MAADKTTTKINVFEGGNTSVSAQIFVSHLRTDIISNLLAAEEGTIFLNMNGPGEVCNGDGAAQQC